MDIDVTGATDSITNKLGTTPFCFLSCSLLCTISLNSTVYHYCVGLLVPGYEAFLCAPSLATRCDVQLSNPLGILTAASMTLDLTVSKRGLGNVVGSGSIHLQSSHMALGTSKSSWTSSASQNTVMTRRPLACKKRHLICSLSKR